ncbi:MAG: maleylpyruvate isomerase family mycothiol-dependent enzyme [Acidimicrobiales bacterium]
MSDLFANIEAQRIALADLLTGLQDQEWETASLCEGWTVHDVVAHLTMPFNLGVPGLVKGLARARGNFARFADRYARAQAHVPSQDLVALLRREASNRFTPPGFGPQAPLTDVVVHGYDVAVPTHRDLEVPEETSTLVLDFLVTKKPEGSFTRRGLVNGLRFEAADGAWAYGAGPLVRGPMRSLLLGLTGRESQLTALEGDGVQVLRDRLATG